MLYAIVKTDVADYEIYYEQLDDYPYVKMYVCDVSPTKNVSIRELLKCEIFLKNKKIDLAKYNFEFSMVERKWKMI